MHEFPRVLVINCEPVHSKSATGLTMMSLFKEWPIDRIAQIYTHPVIPDETVCANTRRVKISLMGPEKLMKEILPISANLSVGKFSGRSGFFKVTECPAVAPGFKYRLHNKIAARMRQITFLMPYKVSDELLSWIDEFKPDAIYSMLYDIDIMDLVSNISYRFKVPVVPHFMDDWPATLNSRHLLYRFLGPALKQKLKNVMKLSPLGLVIGDAMAAEYEVRYNKAMIPFMYCMELNNLKREEKTRDPNATIRFVYIGGLHLNRWKTLKEIGTAMAELAAEGIRLECLIYTHPLDADRYRKELSLPPVMRIVGSLPHDEVHSAQLSADCLTHIESFMPWDKSFTQLSVSSKLPEYLAAGRPIFVYGPDDVASIRYIAEIGCGFIVGQQDTKMLKEKLKEAATSPSLRSKMGHLAFEAAKSRHDASEQRAKFRKTILNASKTGLPTERNNLSEIGQ